jgi:hypothetical protein
MGEEERKAGEKDGDTLIEARVSASALKSFLFSRDGLIVSLVLLFGFPNLAANWRATIAAEETQATVEKVKETAEEKTIPTTKRIEQHAKDIEHELSNGLAERIANKVAQKQQPRFDEMQKQIDAIRRFLTGMDDGAKSIKPSASTAAAN